MLAQSYTALFNGAADIENLKDYDFNEMPQRYIDKEVF